MSEKLHHGGRLRQASARYGILLADWLDLSTGINPNGWPVPTIPQSVWSRLPEEEDGLKQAAADYYGTDRLLPVAGSQAAIQALPRLRAPSRVAVLVPGYAEHAAAWERAGHIVTPVAADQVAACLPHTDVLLLIHPNNPTGARFPLERLFQWQALLAARGGWLVVDEAFMDTTPQHSLAPCSPRPGLVVLRSLGKFFGLAGARVGFVCAEAELLERLDALLGPWQVAGPARWVAAQALMDHRWQMNARENLFHQSERLAALLARHHLAANGGCALFQWTCTPQAAHLQDQLARRGVLVRRFEQPHSLRFGLPGTEVQWARLDAALAEVRERQPAGADA